MFSLTKRGFLGTHGVLCFDIEAVCQELLGLIGNAGVVFSTELLVQVTQKYIVKELDDRKKKDRIM